MNLIKRREEWWYWKLKNNRYQLEGHSIIKEH